MEREAAGLRAANEALAREVSCSTKRETIGIYMFQEPSGDSDVLEEQLRRRGAVAASLFG